jgi:homoserine kinase type II
MVSKKNTEPKILLKDINIFAQATGINEIKYIKLISRGVDSQTFSLYSSKESYILTLSEKLPKHIAFIQNASNFFAAKGFAFPKILAIGEILNKKAIVTEELHGKVKSEFDEKDYFKIGFYLGNLHKASSEFSAISPTLPFIWNLTTLFHEIKKFIPKEFLFLEKEIYLLEESWPQKIPRGFIHGDLWHKNVLFSNDEISGILEFTPSYEPLILDLANLSKPIVTEKPNLFKALLEGYELVRPLSQNEKNYLPLMIYAKTIKTILYLLEKSLQSEKRKDEFLTYAYLGLLKLETLYESMQLKDLDESKIINELLEKRSFDLPIKRLKFSRHKFV